MYLPNQSFLVRINSNFALSPALANKPEPAIIYVQRLKKERLRQEEENNIPEPDVVGSSKASPDDAVGLAAPCTTATFIPLLLHEDGSIQGKTPEIDFDCLNSQLCVEDLSVREATTGHEVHITCDT
jgi:hypothetical protein